MYSKRIFCPYTEHTAHQYIPYSRHSMYFAGSVYISANDCNILHKQKTASLEIRPLLFLSFDWDINSSSPVQIGRMKFPNLRIFLYGVPDIIPECQILTTAF